MDNHALMDQETLPEHLLVLGGGYIGCEFGQMFRRFGAAVTVITDGQHLLPHEDPDVSLVLEAVLRDEGIGLHLGHSVERVTGERGQIQVRLRSGVEVRGTHLLVATGRRPNTADLGCEAAGIGLNPHGAIWVDDQFRTSATGVYAVGDVTPQPQFTHVSWDDHRLLFDILQGRPAHGRAGRHIPFTLFTEPQLARVGLTQTEAERRNMPHEVARLPFEAIARAVETDNRLGLIKVLVDPRDERVLGATILGADAGELLHVFVALMQAGASARTLVEMECVHPTYAEGLQSALMTLPRFALG
jgi:pyruvate/2-oxoglutarate dehydrogenase complex dihydrolipoamide dehydrogenase (E3) component